MNIESIQLTEPSSGATATVLSGFGMNCCQFTVPSDAGPVDAIWTERDFARQGGRPSGNGNPLLFPFPGRIKGTSFAWAGRQYTLSAGDGRGNAIHGFVHERPWRVLQQEGTRVVGQFQASRDDARILAMWPADFCITATYELVDRTLNMSYLFENPDTCPLPCGFGTHPYFRLPLGAGGTADNCIVRVPISTRWELADMNATGKELPFDDAEAFAQGVRFADIQLDAVFGGLVWQDGRCTASIADPASGRRLTLVFNDAFRTVVLYVPPHREAVCIEPYTCVPDPIRLAAEGVDAGLRVLEPGESFEARMAVRID